MQGMIKAFRPAEGYGFISAQGTDFFFHVTDWIGDNTEIVAGRRVEFELGEGRRGVAAKHVRRIEEGE